MTATIKRASGKTGETLDIIANPTLRMRIHVGINTRLSLWNTRWRISSTWIPRRLPR